MITFIGVFATLLRVFALDSDAYARLSWSSALLTDEGFYLHNARNQLLFGHARLDGFNNMLIMPLLHLAQLAWFWLLGVGLVQARLLSVACSLLTLALFWDGLRRAFGGRVALWGLLLLGLDHVNVLYNRLALMDTPGALFLVAGWWAFVRGWWPLCGVLLGAGYGVRGLDALVWPAALGALLWQRRFRDAAGVGWGLAVALGAYGAFWWLPHRAELAQVNGFYLYHQFLPHSPGEAGQDLVRAFASRERGLLPYLLRHSPVQVALCGWLALTRLRSCSVRGRTSTGLDPRSVTLAVWLLTMATVYAVARYSPDRYYVLFYPALAGLSALALVELPQMLRQTRVPERFARFAPVALALLWGSVNLVWIGDWATHLAYTQRDAEHRLSRLLPAGSVLLGDVPTGLCFENRIFPVPIKPGLCNEERPVERFAARPCFLALSDARDVQDWWRMHYPGLLSTGHLLHRFPRIVVGAVTLYTIPYKTISHHRIRDAAVQSPPAELEP